MPYASGCSSASAARTRAVPRWRVQLPASEARRVKLGRAALAIGSATAKRAVRAGSVRIVLARRVRDALRGKRSVVVRVTTRLDGRVLGVEQVTLQR